MLACSKPSLPTAQAACGGIQNTSGIVVSIGDTELLGQLASVGDVSYHDPMSARLNEAVGCLKEQQGDSSEESDASSSDASSSDAARDNLQSPRCKEGTKGCRIRWHSCDISYPTYSRTQYNRRVKERRYTLKEMNQIREELVQFNKELFPDISVCAIAPPSLLRQPSFMEKLSLALTEGGMKLKKTTSQENGARGSLSPKRGMSRSPDNNAKKQERLRGRHGRGSLDLKDFGQQPKIRSVI